jgi:phosphatidylglycerophosphate synthase
MYDVALRQQKDRLLGPLAGPIFASVHPNVVSCVGLLVGLLSIAAIIQQAYWAGLGLWLLNRSLDGLDGLVARQHGKQSDFGGYLDLFLDFLVYLGIPIVFVVAQPTTANLWAGLGLFAAYYLNTMSWTTLAALLEKRRLQSTTRLTSLEMPMGLIEGAETILFYSLFYLLPHALTLLFSLMALLVLFTAQQRLWWAYRNLR